MMFPIALQRAAAQSTPVTTVSAASYSLLVAPESIVAAFGVGLATEVAVATSLPLPTTLAGTTVRVNGEAAPLFFVAPNQINYLIPAGTPVGAASVVVTAGDGAVSHGIVQIVAVAPALFTADSSGRGPLASLLLRVKASGELIYEQLSVFDGARFVTVPVDFGESGDRLFLILYATGVRQAATGSVRVSISGVEFAPLYAGPSGGFVGLDQLNVALPDSFGGRGRLELLVTAVGAPGSNAGEFEIGAGAASNAAPVQITGVSTGLALAGEEIEINGSGFAPNPGENQVLMVADDGITARADVVTVTGNSMRVRMPFGAGTGQLRVSRGQSETGRAISVRTSISGFVEEARVGPGGVVERIPIPGARVRLLGRPATERSVGIDGSFVIPDPPGIPAGGSAFVEILPPPGGALPLPVPRLKVAVRADRDNQLPLAAELSQVGGVPFPSSPSEGVAGESAAAQTLTLTYLPPGRTPANLPAGHFSARIAQITPFGMTITPGARLSFPNADMIPVGATARLFKFDQTEGSATLGSFIDAGAATVSADGQTVETSADAITEGSYYFVSIERGRATINGRVVETDGRGVPRAIVRARGQSTFTDGFGGFVLRDVPVMKNSGDRVMVEVSYQRPSGRISRKDSAEVEIVAGMLSTIASDIVLDPATTNVAPIIIAPAALALNAGEGRSFDVVVLDPDSSQPLQVAASGSAAAFTTLSNRGQGVHRLQMNPNAQGAFTLNLAATDASGDSTMQSIAVMVNQGETDKPSAQSQSVTTMEDATVEITLSGAAAGGGTLSYTVVAPPSSGMLAGEAPNLRYTPAADYNGADGFTFKVASNGVESGIATVFIAVIPVNDAPVLSVPGPQMVNAGSALQLSVSATDVDSGQVLNFTAANLPDGATFTPVSAASWQMSWTPTFAQAGTYNVEFKVTDNGNPPLSRMQTVAINVGVLWSKLSGPEGGRLAFLYFSGGSTVFAGNAGGLLRSTDDGRSWSDAAEGLRNLNVASMTQIGATLFVATVGGGVHRSTNGGNSWEQVNTGLTNQTLNFVFASGNTLFAGTFFSGRVFRSTNMGGNWAEIPTALTQGASPGRVDVMAVRGSDLFIGTDKDGVFRADLDGNNWTPARTGLPQLTGGAYDRIRTFAAGGNALYAGTSGNGVYRSTDNGATWAALNTGLTNLGINGLAASGPNVYVATFLGGVYKLGGNNTWMRIGAGLVGTAAIECMALNGGTILIGENLYGVYRSTDLGENFAFSNSGLNILNIGGIYSDGATLYVSGEYGAMFRSSNDGESMILARNGLPGLNFKGIAAIGNNLFVGSSAPIGVYRSTDQGQNWAPANSGIADRRLEKLLASGNALYAAGRDGVVRTTNLGVTWTDLSNGLRNYFIRDLAVIGTTLFIAADSSNNDGTPGPGLLRSTDGGATWTPANTGIARRSDGTLPSFFGLAVIGTTLYAGAVDVNGVYRSTDNGETWTAAKNGLTSTFILALVANGPTLFAADNGNGIYRSDDGAATWRRFDAGLTRRTITTIAAQGNTVFAGGFGGLVRASPNIQSWSERNTGLPGRFINAVAASSDSLYAGALGNGVARSTDHGASWSAVNNGLPPNANVQSVVSSGGNLFAGLFGDGVYRSTDQGASWSAFNTGLANTFVNKLFISGSTIYAGADAGVFRSGVGAASWTAVTAGLGALRVVSFTANAGVIYAGTDGGGVFRLNPDGAGWTQINNGLGNLQVTALFVSGALYAGTSGGGVYISRDGGENWTAINNGLPPRLHVFAFAASGKKIYIGSVYGVFITEDEGSTWKQINSGLLETYVSGLAVSGDQLFAATLRGGVFVSRIPQ
ncbi:MAG: hypothetical protein KIT57_18815 [Blastocatellales bacterium]|nr:hypothetical protein [Blastocatellales bacterium]